MKKPLKPIAIPVSTISSGEGYLDKVAVGKLLGMKPKTVREWVMQGKLPAYKFGRYLRFKWAEVDAHMAANYRVNPGGTSGGVARANDLKREINEPHKI